MEQKVKLLILAAAAAHFLLSMMERENDLRVPHGNR
jgi:hypothetical protein